eukprot:CAMPEP_0117689678 /NCGR_PEP_ID=MMETSP0804-20121206/24651_1 /TAXON_ID=1074897 /ORGANISM="Tetraselmis astigmatica, Strain CCMP880" /LENGTH=575 /DNA_ID=CAMNT_0005502533 /DNA_START=94 /DNA_END=1822 /DNA_ORIENTATION=+
MFSATCFVASLFILYVSVAAYQIGSLFFPDTCAPQTAHSRDCLHPIVAGDDPNIDVLVFISKGAKKSLANLAKSNHSLLYKGENIRLSKGTEAVLDLPVDRVLTKNRNSSLYAHIYVWDATSRMGAPEASQLSPEPAEDLLPAGSPVASAVARLTKHLPARQRQHKMLLGEENTTAGGEEALPEGIYTHIRPHVTLLFVGPKQASYKSAGIGREIAWALTPVAGRYMYRPLMWVDDFSVIDRDFRPLSPNASSPNPKVPLKVKITHIGMMRLSRQLQQAMVQLQAFGFSEKDLEEVKDLLNTQWQWLLATLGVSLLHSLFAFLAFKNDIGFWKGRKNMEGISARSYVASLVCMIIIFLNLLEGGQTSGIVLAEVGVGVLIEAWKVVKILGSKGLLSMRGGKEGRKDTRSKREIETDQYDAWSPPAGRLAYGVYSLMYYPQRSWLGWLLSTLSKGVYMFGFITMAPQLYINYRLKSVAHLPWKAFMYKAFNTFVDDVFAFAITMPLAHRLACLRDDLVFFIYLYQRWLYPVDKTRVNEFGLAYEEDKGEGLAALPEASARQATAEEVKSKEEKKDD